MITRTPSTFRLIGAGLTSLGVIATIFAPGGLRAQQLAATDLATDRATYLDARCGHISDETRKVGCRSQASIEFDNARAATAKQVIISEEQLQRCTAFLRAKRDSGVIFNRQITRANVCPYAIELGMRDGPG